MASQTPPSILSDSHQAFIDWLGAAANLVKDRVQQVGVRVFLEEMKTALSHVSSSGTTYRLSCHSMVHGILCWYGKQGAFLNNLNKELQI